MASSKESFFKAHYDWLIALVGILALAGAGMMFLMSDEGGSADEYASSHSSRFKMLEKKNKGVAAVEVEMSTLNTVFKGLKKPILIKELEPKKGNFLVSGRRVFCRAGDAADKDKACKFAIPDGLKECPICGVKQFFEKVEIDSDSDGLPNDWEKKYGLNPNDASDVEKDFDKDGFTNMEEFVAKTDPSNAASHPDYLDSLSVAGELNQTFLPFWLRDYNPIPNSYRLTFERNNVKDRYDATYRIKVGDKICLENGKGDSGFVLKSFNKKLEKRVIKGSKTKAMREEDISVATVVRVSDGKEIEVPIKVKKIPVEAQVTLAYNRNGLTSMTVSKGSEITLSGQKYKVVDLKEKDKKCEVTVEDSNGNKKIIR